MGRWIFCRRSLRGRKGSSSEMVGIGFALTESRSALRMKTRNGEVFVANFVEFEHDHRCVEHE